MDSLNTRKNDSAYTCGGRWYKCEDTANYSIFTQSIKSKSVYWTDYFEGGERHRLVLGIGMVRSGQYGAQFSLGHRLKGCLFDGILYGDTSLVGINQLSSEVPERFTLSQNYPNPFNPVTNIQFALPKSGFIKITVYDALGKEAESLLQQDLNAGSYETQWNAENYPSGVYYYNLSAGEFSITKKMVLVK